MENVVKIDKRVLEKIKRRIIVIEKENLATKELKDSQMLEEIKKIIEEEVIID